MVDAHGHMPHDPFCSVCVHARFRRAAAKKMEANHKVGGAAWGWVLGIDYFGPFDPDCDDNVWGLCGVETAHTDLGFLELSANIEGGLGFYERGENDGAGSNGHGT